MPDARIGDLQVGTVLGERHRIGSRLGEGGMAITYEATHVMTGAEVAIKVMKPEGADDPELQARFMREAEVMGRLNDSANIVSVYDLGTHVDGRGYIVMEFVRGVNLQNELEDLQALRESGAPGGRMPVERICKIALDVARGIRDAHAAGVVHRDVKPANIMIAHTRDHGEIAKLVDFGVSADLGKKGIERTLTRAGVSIGTPEYMAPEQSLGLAAAPSFDVFALGVTMYEMATGELPPPVIEMSKGLPELGTITDEPALDGLIRGCLEPNPDDRIQTAEEVALRLEQILARRIISAKPHPKSAPWLLVGGVVVGVLGIGGGIALAWNLGAFDRAPTPAEDAGERPTRADDGSAPEVAVASTSMVREPEPEPDASAGEPEPGEPTPESGEPESASGDPAPEPSPESEPEPGPSDASPRPEPEPASKRRPEPKPKAAAAEYDAEGCKTLREEAGRAKASGRWRDVLRTTTERSCWPDKGERQKMRIEALLELKEFERCVSEGAGSKDSAVTSMVKFCKRNLELSEGSR